MFLEHFEVPCLQELNFFEKFGYNVVWKDDKDKFIADLDRIELKEKKFISKLEAKIKENNDAKEKKAKLAGGEIDPEKQLLKEREAFVRMLNSLGKIGYKIDRPTTSVEELSLMIKQQKEEAELIKSKK